MRATAAKPNVDVVIAYTRVSTTGQADSGAGLDAQAAALAAWAGRRGVTIAHTLTDVGSGRSLNRPKLQEALAMLDRGDAGVLVVAKLDRLSRSVRDFADLLDRASARGWRIAVLDVDVDTTTPSGELLAGIVAQVSQYERRIIGQRTRDALAARKAAGVKLGRPRLVDPAVAERIRGERQAGRTLASIADGLNAEAILTPSQRDWSPATVRKIALQEAASPA